MSEPIIVLIEDEPQIRRFLRTTLGSQGYRLFEAATGADGLVEAASRQPDVVIVDLGLPDIDGLEMIRRIREWSTVPIIVLSARGQEADKVVALDVGADDYVSKPFGAEELLARVRVALRHKAGVAREDAVFTAGDLRVDLGRRHVFVRDQEVKLTPTEYRLLTTLVRYAGRVLKGANLAGANRPYDYMPFFWSDFFDLGWEAVGDIDASLDVDVVWKEPFREGVLYYMNEDVVRGVLLWNVWDRVESARDLIRYGRPTLREERERWLHEGRIA